MCGIHVTHAPSEQNHRHAKAHTRLVSNIKETNAIATNRAQLARLNLMETSNLARFTELLDAATGRLHSYMVNVVRLDMK